jgi:hypothetical protein
MRTVTCDPPPTHTNTPSPFTPPLSAPQNKYSKAFAENFVDMTTQVRSHVVG